MITVIGDGQFKASAAFSELQLLKKTHICQQTQGSINRREGYLELLLGQLLMHLFRTEVTSRTSFAEQIKNPLALRSHPTAVLMQSLLKRGIHGSSS